MKLTLFFLIHVLSVLFTVYAIQKQDRKNNAPEVEGKAEIAGLVLFFLPVVTTICAIILAIVLLTDFISESINQHNLIDTEFKPCPFCGCRLFDEQDTIYPSGIMWKDNGQYKWYVSRKDDDGTYHNVWKLHCSPDYGGCGVEITGHDKQETIEKWNRRV